MPSQKLRGICRAQDSAWINGMLRDRVFFGSAWSRHFTSSSKADFYHTITRANKCALMLLARWLRCSFQRAATRHICFIMIHREPTIEPHYKLVFSKSHSLKSKPEILCLPFFPDIFHCCKAIECERDWGYSHARGPVMWRWHDCCSDCKWLL